MAEIFIEKMARLCYNEICFHLRLGGEQLVKNLHLNCIERSLPLYDTATSKIAHPQWLRITDCSGNTFQGGDQEWYPLAWQQRAGCGPTNGSNLLWYLSRVPGCEALCRHDASQKEGFVQLMENVWPHITPGHMGVNSAQIFVDGAISYAAARGVALHVDALEVPTLPFHKPAPGDVAEFLSRHLDADLPVAFLNLSNGALKNLDNWHWVTLVALNEPRMTAVMCDAGRLIEIDLGLWLRTTTLGGAFVVCGLNRK